MPLNEPKVRKRIIPIRYKTPSRQKIVLIVAQLQDAFGNWMVPTITISDRIPLIIESGRFAGDIGKAFSTASTIHDDWMVDVKIVDMESNKYTDPSVEDG